MAGAGVGTDGTSFMFSVKENNWLGRGVKLETALNLSEEKVKGSILVNNPNYNYSGNAVFASLDITSLEPAKILLVEVFFLRIVLIILKKSSFEFELPFFYNNQII